MRLVLSDEIEVREYVCELPDFFSCSRLAIIVIRCDAGDAKAVTNSKLIPPGAQSRHVELGRGGLVPAVVSNVGHVNREALGDCALDIQTPFRDARVFEARVYRGHSAW